MSAPIINLQPREPKKARKRSARKAAAKGPMQAQTVGVNPALVEVSNSAVDNKIVYRKSFADELKEIKLLKDTGFVTDPKILGERAQSIGLAAQFYESGTPEAKSFILRNYGDGPQAIQQLADDIQAQLRKSKRDATLGKLVGVIDPASAANTDKNVKALKL